MAVSSGKMEKKFRRRARGTHLEDMEGLKLDVLALITEHVHHHLEVRLMRNVLGHDVEIGAVQ